MASKNNNGGTGWIFLILLLILLVVLYGCFGEKAGLPPLPGMATASSSSPASPTPGSGPTSASSEVSASDTSASDMSDSAGVSDSAASPPSAGGFTFLAPTDLIPGSWTSDGSSPSYTSYSNLANWSPSMCFPTEGLAYANSQVFDPGGSNYPTRGAAHNGDQCALSNYSYPWRDNFCEFRGTTSSTKNILCHSGYGHQGQDIRPATCQASINWAVAPEASRIKDIGSYTLTLRAISPPYRVYRYLHMNPAFRTRWHIGDNVQAGQKLGQIANFGLVNGVIQPYTTIHLHFEMRLDVAETIDGQLRPANTFVPPYSALVAAYQRKMAGMGCPVVQ